MPKPKSEASLFSGGAYGSIYVLSYSGFIILEGGAVLDPQILTRAGMQFTFHPPTRIADATWRPIPQFTAEKFSALFPGAPSNMSLLRIAIVPAIDEEGRPALRHAFADDDSLSAYVDTYVVAVREGDQRGRGQQVSEDILGEVFDWLRVLTKQWWIGKPTEGITGNHNIVLNLLSESQVDGLPLATGRQTSPISDTLLVTREIWADAFERVRRRSKPAAAAVLEANAYHYFFSQDYRTAIILFCASCEIARDEALERKGKSYKGLGFGTDILKHLSVEFERLFERNLEREHPALFSTLKSLWIARNRVAHGRPIVWRVDGVEQPFSNARREHLTASVRGIHDWLSSI